MTHVLTVEDIVVQPPEGDQVVDPMTWFASPGPFELEIGCGKGGFLLARARAAPQVRLLGIEWANKYFKSAADRMARWQLTNVRVMRTDARTFVLRNLPPDSVSVIHLYHPDPWPKKRHHKRRLVQRDFVTAAVRALRPHARWLIQSDHAEYFGQIQQLLAERTELVPIAPQEGACEVDSAWAGTNFEIKYTREGRPIYRAAYAKG